LDIRQAAWCRERKRRDGQQTAAFSTLTAAARPSSRRAAGLAPPSSPPARAPARPS
jgi:hypothetical protein